jgi:hypothetical protein
MRPARTCTGAGAGLTVLVRRKRLGAVVSGTLLAAGSLLARSGVFDAGMASARNANDTVGCQRERMAVRGNESASSMTP